MNFQPAIKWSGSKRSQCDEIISYFPRKIETYYESFLGGGSVAYRLMNSDINVNKFVLSDLNSDLINLYKLIQNDYKSVISHYELLWNELNKDSDFERKKLYFAEIRKRLNERHDPKDFMFIMRTTTNGMPRYNSDGEFNNSFHVTRNGIEPFRLEKILKEWNDTLNNHNVEFINASYDEFCPNENDFCYYDPPYANTKGMYFGAIDNGKFFSFLSDLKCPYCFSFDGFCEDEDSTYDVPKSVYDEHIYLKNGNSSFRRVIGNKTDKIIYESLYIKGCKKQKESLFDM